MFETLCLVVPDRAALMDLWALQSEALDNYAAGLVTTDGQAEHQQHLAADGGFYLPLAQAHLAHDLEAALVLVPGFPPGTGIFRVFSPACS